ncbi:MAG: potassium channel family protein, partial [Planctomycetota bacterium]
YSFVTLTTLGYGDVTPVSAYAKNLAILEALVGQIYLAVFIAQLVGLRLAERLSGKDAQ